MTLTGRSAGIARILAGTGPDRSGMGIVVGPRHVLTCAHVVNTALVRDAAEATEPHPRAVIHVDFPFAPGAASVRANWVRWRSPGELAGDLALLETEENIPEDVGLAVLAEVRGVPTLNDPLTVFGYPERHPSGQHVEASLKGTVGVKWDQIVGRDKGDVFVEGGFSGGAIWDEAQDAVIGMVVAREASAAKRVAYAIPVTSLKEFVPELQIETRRVFNTFYATWATLATVTLILLLLHFLRTRFAGASGLDTILFWAPDSQLAELWGMHIFMVLGPFLFGLLLLHATSFRLHPWWQRVPAFRSRGPAAGVYNTPVSAAVSLVLFAAIPLYIQAFFIHQFHDDEGAVAIYPDDFGFTVAGLRAENQVCSVESTVCTHPQAGLYSLVEPVNGASGGYWDNAYHYGNASDLMHTQTFFPILQPVVIYAFSGIAVLFAILALITIFRPRPMPFRSDPENPAAS